MRRSRKKHHDGQNAHEDRSSRKETTMDRTLTKTAGHEKKPRWTRRSRRPLVTKKHHDGHDAHEDRWSRKETTMDMTITKTARHKKETTMDTKITKDQVAA